MGCWILRCGPHNEGQTLAEFALVLVVFMLIIMGIVDFSRAVYTRSVVASAAREGARYAVTHRPDTPEKVEAVKAVAKQLAVGVSHDPNLFEVQVTYPYTDPYSDSKRVRVDVSYKFQPISVMIACYVDGNAGAGLTLCAQSTMRVEE